MDKNKNGVVTLEEFIVACQEVCIVQAYVSTFDIAVGIYVRCYLYFMICFEFLHCHPMAYIREPSSVWLSVKWGHPVVKQTLCNILSYRLSPLLSSG